MIYTVSKAVEKTGMSKSKILRLIDDGFLGAGWDGHRWIIDDDDLRNYRYSLNDEKTTERNGDVRGQAAEGALPYRTDVGSVLQDEVGGKAVRRAKEKDTLKRFDELERAADADRKKDGGGPTGRVA